jgi:hypothetical protein
MLKEATTPLPKHLHDHIPISFDTIASTVETASLNNNFQSNNKFNMKYEVLSGKYGRVPLLGCNVV